MRTYNDKYNLGNGYMEYMAERCRQNPQWGYTITPYETKWEQYHIGESVEGIEVKRETYMASTDCIFIEYAEVGHRSGEWIDSGVFRWDNTTVYLIGDYERAFFVPVEVLRYIVVMGVVYPGWGGTYLRNGTCEGRISSHGVIVPLSLLQKFPHKFVNPQTGECYTKHGRLPQIDERDWDIYAYMTDWREINWQLKKRGTLKQ